MLSTIQASQTKSLANAKQPIRADLGSPKPVLWLVWFIHFVQDVLIFSFMAIGAVAAGGK